MGREPLVALTPHHDVRRSGDRVPRAPRPWPDRPQFPQRPLIAALENFVTQTHPMPRPGTPISRPRPSRPWSLNAAGLCDPGLVRPTNEDAYLVRPDLGLFVVADGMGGHAAGEVASHMAIGTLTDVFEHPDAPPGLPLLMAAVQRAGACIRAAARADAAKAGMGTTLTALLNLQDRIAIAHVGDSRAYHLRGRRLHQVTEDHSLVAALHSRGFMSAEDAEVSDYRHLLLRAVGTDDEVTVDGRLLAVEPGDTLLLTSDGVHGVVSDEAIAAILTDERDPTRAANRLIACANEAGGPDNATVVVVRIG